MKISRRNIIILLIVIAVIAVLIAVGPVTVWDVILLEPILNLLIILSSVFFGSFGVAIIVLTIIVRLLMLPLTLRQLRSTRAMQALSPKLQELQKKYGKDQQKLQQEMAKIYKESGVSPLGCVWPLLVQFPIWIALYRSIMGALATSPEQLLSLSQHLYSLSLINQTVPLEAKFLWLNLGAPDPWFILAILVGGSMWVLQKMSAVSTPDPRTQSMNRTMLLMFPLMFGLFTLLVPSGLGLFWVVSNIVGIGLQYRISGWGTLFTRGRAPAPAPQPAKGREMETPEGAVQQEKLAAEEVQAQKRVEHGKSRDKRKDRRRSSRARSRKARRKS